MYPISNAVKALFDAEQRQVLRITGTDRNGAPIAITEANVMEDGFNIDRFSCNGTKLEIGTAISAEMTLKLDNRQGQFNGIVFEGAELFVEIGIADWTQSEPTITYIPCGYFTPDEQPRSLGIITIHALDRMMKFDMPPGLVPWTDETGERLTDENGNVIYFLSNLSFPMRIHNLITAACQRCGVPFSQNLAGYPNHANRIASLPVLNQDVTFRNIIQWCAGIMGTNAWIDWNGALQFSWYDNLTNYRSYPENRFNGDLYENALRITGVQFTALDEERTVHLSGSSDNALDLSDNYILITRQSADMWLKNIYNKVHDFTYTPFSVTAISAPYLWPMDRVSIFDRIYHTSIITNVNFGLNTGTVLKAVGQTHQDSKGVPVASFTSQQTQEIERIQRVNSNALSEAVDHATQMITGGLGGYVVLSVNEQTGQTEEILIMDTPDKNTAVNVWRFNQGGLGHSSNGYNGPFNDVALTADGQINANMITVGEMVADRIKGGTLTLGGYDNVNGHLELKNSQNNVVGIWNKDGLNVGNGNFMVDMSGELTAQGATIENGAIKGGTIQIGKYYDQSQNELYVFSVTQYGALKITSSLNGDWIMIDQGRIIGGIAGQDESTASTSMNFKGAFDDGDGLYINGGNITFDSGDIYVGKNDYNLRQCYTGTIRVGGTTMTFINGLFVGN